jgi:hypothetical protein
MTDRSQPLSALDFRPSRQVPGLEAALAGPRPWQALATAAALPGLLDALGPEPVLACHDAAFQRGLLEAWGRRCGQALPEIQWRCTLDLAQRICPDPGIAKDLDSLAWLLGLRHGPLRAREGARLAHLLHPLLLAWEAVRAALEPGVPLVYLAGPVRGDGSPAWIRFNQGRMLRLARWAQGVLPGATLFVPHGNFAFLDESRDPTGRVRHLAMRGCEQVLARCDALVLCAAEPSQGMLRELKLARKLGLPVFQVPGWDGFPGPAGRAAGAA